MKYWLMKSEPSEYSIQDLQRDKKEMWDGVRNYQARNFMRDDMRVGDLVLFYHSNTDPLGVAGVAKICSEPYPDPTAFDSKDSHYDPKSKKESPTWVLVDVCFVEEFKRVVTLSEMKADTKLAGMFVTKRGMRLSVQPVEKKHFERVLVLAKKVTNKT